MTTHKAQAIIQICIDFRFHAGIVEELARIGIKAFDLKSDAGAVKCLIDGRREVREWVLENFRIAASLHEVETVVLINHSDCGAYGGSDRFGSAEEEQAFHEDQLSKARAVVEESLPQMKVRTFFAKRQDEGKVALIEL